MGATTVENRMEMPQKIKNRTTIWSSYPTPGHLSRENHDPQRHMYSNVHWALFAIAKTWKQPQCPSTEEWIQKMWYIYTMEYYSAIKKNKIPAFSATWMDLETIMLSKVSHTMRHQRQMLSLTCGLWKEDRLNFFAEQMLTHRHWKTYGLQRRQFGGWRDVLGLWDRNPVKSDCYDHCTTTDVINSFE